MTNTDRLDSGATAVDGRKSNTVRAVARVLWFFPVVLLLLGLNQLKVGRDLRTTALEGVPATAEVTDFMRVDRADVTYGHVGLRVHLPDGSIITKEKMPLPYSLLHRVESEDELAVHVLRNASQDVVIDIVSNAQWKMALIQGIIALVAAVMATVGVVAWSSYLRRNNDPALRTPESAPRAG